jgi:glycosyltransferase involved in cell wall biosynthesis
MVLKQKYKRKHWRIALLLHKPLPKIPRGVDMAALTIINILNRLPQVSKVEIFAISDKDYEEKIKISNNIIIQKHVKGYGYPEEGLSRFLDLLGLFIFGFRPSLILIKKNKKVLDTLANYNPDFIISLSFPVAPIIDGYRLFNKKVKIISYTDSPEVLSVIFNYLEGTKLPKFFKILIRKLFYKKYIKFHKKVFINFIKSSDIVVTPTEFDKDEIAKLSGINKDKIFVIPPVSYRKSEIKKLKPILKIEKIVFLGACNFWPNLEAIEIIKTKIAPKLRDIEFIIVGKGCKPQKEGNITIIGEVKGLEPILKEASAFIAPILSGRGIKTKVLTYFLYQKPVIGTSLAFRGYKVKDNYNVIIEDNIDKIWERIYELNRNKKLILKIQKNSTKAIEDFEISKLKQKWIKVLRNKK